MMGSNSLLKLQNFLLSKSAFAAGDQVLLSVGNLVLSIFVLKNSSIETFGIYSFLMVFVSLGNSTIASLLHGQMTLRIAGTRRAIQRSYLKQTFGLYLIISSILSFSVVLIAYFYVEYSGELLTLDQIVLSVVALFLISLYDLSKRYLYVIGQQKCSFFFSLVYLVSLLVGLVTYLVLSPSGNLVNWAFGINCSALTLSLTFNKFFFSSLREGRSQSLAVKNIIFKSYLDQGRFGLVGTMVTWAQNQSITPLLMFFAGPAVVGYFNIARLIMMPVTVVNIGILGSALPELRSLVKLKSFQTMYKALKKFCFLNVCICIGYLCVLLLSHASGISQKVIPEYDSAANFLFLWSIVVLIMTYRSWIAQHFIVLMEFKYLLITGLIATSITLCSMIAGFYWSNSFYVLAVGVIIGDCYLIYVFKRKLSSEHYSNLP